MYLCVLDSFNVCEICVCMYVYATECQKSPYGMNKVSIYLSISISRQVCWQTSMQTDRSVDRQLYGQIGMQTDRSADRQVLLQTDRSRQTLGKSIGQDATHTHTNAHSRPAAPPVIILWGHCGRQQMDGGAVMAAPGSFGYTSLPKASTKVPCQCVNASWQHKHSFNNLQTPTSCLSAHRASCAFL